MADKERYLGIGSDISADIQKLTGETGLDETGKWKLAEGLIFLIARLATYREEGVPLRPNVYIFEAHRDFENVSGFHHFFNIESMTFSSDLKSVSDIYLRALKKCAPLARLGWSLFIRWHGEGQSNLVFGVMRRHLGILKGPAENLLLNSNARFKFMVIRQTAENLVEVVTKKGRTTYNFSLNPSQHLQRRSSFLSLTISLVKTSVK